MHKRKNIDLYNPVDSNLPQIQQDNRGPSRSKHYNQQNLAYVNVSKAGNEPVGPIGLKRAEKELIMRRYKNAYMQNDSMNRVALIYGQQHPSYNSHDR